MSIQRYNAEDHPSDRLGDFVEADDGEMVYYADHLAALEAERAKVRKWEPIDTAPKDNERPLYLARIDDAGVQEIGWDGVWRDLASGDEPSWFGWASAMGIPEEPTHWAYQDAGAPPLEAERAKGRVWWCLRAPSGCEWMYPNDPGIPKESGWTCRKVRVVEVEVEVEVEE